MRLAFSTSTPMPFTSPGDGEAHQPLVRDLLEGGEADTRAPDRSGSRISSFDSNSPSVKLFMACVDLAEHVGAGCSAERGAGADHEQTRGAPRRFSWLDSIEKRGNEQAGEQRATGTSTSPASVPNRCMTGDLPSASTKKPSDTSRIDTTITGPTRARDLVGALAPQVPQVVHGEVGAGAGGDAGDQRGAEIDGHGRGCP